MNWDYTRRNSLFGVVGIVTRGSHVFEYTPAACSSPPSRKANCLGLFVPNPEKSLRDGINHTSAAGYRLSVNNY